MQPSAKLPVFVKLGCICFGTIGAAAAAELIAMGLPGGEKMLTFFYLQALFFGGGGALLALVDKHSSAVPTYLKGVGLGALYPAIVMTIFMASIILGLALAVKLTGYVLPIPVSSVFAGSFLFVVIASIIGACGALCSRLMYSVFTFLLKPRPPTP